MSSYIYNFNEEYKLIKELCEKLNKPVSTINGSIKDLKDFKDKSNTITLVQYQAGAMGHNLQLANKIIYFTLPLSSELFEQSKKRIHRIGQEKTCFYYYLIVDRAFEGKIFETLKLKEIVYWQVIWGGRTKECGLGVKIEQL